MQTNKILSDILEHVDATEWNTVTEQKQGYSVLGFKWFCFMAPSSVTGWSWDPAETRCLVFRFWRSGYFLRCPSLMVPDLWIAAHLWFAQRCERCRSRAHSMAAGWLPPRDISRYYVCATHVHSTMQSHWKTLMRITGKEAGATI